MKFARVSMGAAILWGAALGSGWNSALANGIYTCVDAKGRKLTSDRPIPECLDREQNLLNPSGTLKEKIGPNLTAAERSQKEAAERKKKEEQNRIDDERRRDRALLVRYPNQEVHDKERQEALAQIDVVTNTAHTRLAELAAQRKKLDQEMEFYQKDPKKAPQNLKRQLADNQLSIESQEKFIVDQAKESGRLNQRFDQELVRLRQLWSASSAGK